jgi:hypothetical protein
VVTTPLRKPRLRLASKAVASDREDRTDGSGGMTSISFLRRRVR